MSRQVILHCSDSSFGTVQLIDEWHAARGFKRRDPDRGLTAIGYHYVIENGWTTSRHERDYDPMRDGQIVTARYEHEIGAHAQGSNDAVGICLIGKATFTRRQLTSMYALVIGVCLRNGSTFNDVLGHCETPVEVAKGHGRKSCPNLNMDRVREKLRMMLVGVGVQLINNGEQKGAGT